MKRIARYGTTRGAARYARDLKATWPMYDFDVVTHPRDFAWTVMLLVRGQHTAYVLARPRGGVHALPRYIEET